MRNRNLSINDFLIFPIEDADCHYFETPIDHDYLQHSSEAPLLSKKPSNTLKLLFYNVAISKKVNKDIKTGVNIGNVYNEGFCKCFVKKRGFLLLLI